MIEVPAEIAEVDATGLVYGLYEDIRATMEIGMVNLIYRRMAAVDGLLEWVWGVLRPLLASDDVEEALLLLAAGAGQASSQSTFKLERHQMDIEDQELPNLKRVLDDYNRGNGLNLLLLTAFSECLLLGGPKVGEMMAEKADRRPLRSCLPPIIAMTDMSKETASLIQELSKLIAPSDRPLIPSLFRHLAHWPGFLTLVAPHITSFVSSGELATLSDSAKHCAKDFSLMSKEQFISPVELTPPSADVQAYWLGELNAYISKPIPEMVVIGNALRHALP